MDTETALDEAAPTAVNTTEPLDEMPSAPGKIYHFNLYGRASRGDLAAFAAARALLESAVPAAGRKSDGRTDSVDVRAGPVRHYVVRFMTGGRADTPTVDREFDSVPALHGTTSRHHRQTDERANVEEPQTRFVITVLLGAKRGGNIPEYVSHEGSPRCGKFDFTVVNGSVIHCVWAS